MVLVLGVVLARIFFAVCRSALGIIFCEHFCCRRRCCKFWDVSVVVVVVVGVVVGISVVFVAVAIVVDIDGDGGNGTGAVSK